MTDERWQRAAAIVDAALAVDEPTTRQRYVAEACAEDATLAADVARWLAAIDTPSSLLDGSPLPPGEMAALLLEATMPLGVGARVGAWRIERHIGSGGMGEVYEAARADGAFERRAALKVERRRAGAGARLRQFQRERELLATLDHPNIARLLDGGVTDDGQPYLVMELVEGEAIDAWCDARALPVRARVSLLRQACAALAYAHRRLIVHRDVKPSNILVTSDGTVKLVDFGIARAIDAGRHTAADATTTADGAPLAAVDAVATAAEATAAPDSTQTSAFFTPAYASPEQFRGEPGSTASDVYALGAVLHRLLTGRAPHADAGHDVRAIAAAALRGGIMPPSRVAPTPARARAIAGDLDAIVLRALATAPDARYPSVEALDRDLANHLADRPVDARAEGALRRGWKFVRRNRLASAVTAAVLLAIGGVSILAMRQAARANAEAARATEVNDFLLALLELPYPFDSGATRQQSLRALLDSGRARVSTLTRSGDGRGSDVLLALARGYSGVGDQASAAELAGRAVRARARGGRDDPSMAAARTVYAAALGQVGRTREALAQWDSAIATMRRVHGARAMIVGNFLAARGRVLMVHDAPDSAESTLREALAILADSAGPRSVPYSHAVQWLGHLRRGQGQHAEAESLYRAALAVHERIGGNVLEIANLEGDIAMARLALGGVAVAESLVQRSRARKRDRLGDVHAEIADDEVKLGHIALARDDARDAERWFTQAAATYTASGPMPAWRLTQALEGVALAQARQGRRAAAQRTARDALSRMAREHRGGLPAVAKAYPALDSLAGRP